MAKIADDIRVLVEIGGPLTVSQLAAALEAEPDVVLSVCDELSGQGLLDDQVEGLVAKTPLSDVSNARRMLLAERLVSVLEESPIDPDRHGRLYLAAGRPDLAFPLLAEAATDPTKDQSEAIELLTLALRTAPDDTPPPTVGRLRLARARRYRSAGLTAPAVEDATEAIALLAGDERVDALALASVLADDSQHPQESERWAGMALLEAGRLRAHPKFGSLLSLQARELARLGFANEAAVEQAAGLAIASAEGNEVQQFYTLVNAARTELDAGDVRTAATSYEHLRDVARRFEGDVVVAAQEVNLARALLLGGDVNAGLECVERARAIAMEADVPVIGFLADIALAEGLLAFHRYEEALTVSARIAETADSALPAWRNRATGYRAIALIRLRRLDEARAEVDRALAETPAGGDGLRLRLWLDCWKMAANPSRWDQHAAENLTDLLIQSGWLQTAAEFMVIRAARERHPEVASEAAALAFRLGQPMLAADALETGKLWSTPAAAAIANHLREVERSLPDDWLRDWLELSAVRSGLGVDVRDDGEAAEALRLEVEQALGGLDSAALSPAQRVASGAVRRRQRTRTVARTAFEALVAAALALAVFMIFFRPDQPPPPPDWPTIEPPADGLQGAVPFAGGPTRFGVFEGSVGEPTGIYWDLAVGGSFRAPPVVFGNTVFIGSSEGRFYSIDLVRGSTTFEELASDSIDVAAAVAKVSGFGEGGQSEDVALLGSADGALTAITLGDTGGLIWTFETDGAISGAPIVIEKTIYFASSDGYVYAVDGPGGFEIERFPRSAPVEGGFTHALAADDAYLYAVGGGDLYMLDLRTLEPVCVVDLAARAQVVTHPVVAEGAVFVGTSLRTIAVFGPGNCGAAPAGLSPSHNIDVRVNHAPVVEDGVIWAAADELLLALDPVTSRLEAIDVGGVITSPPVMADGLVVMAIEGGDLVAVDAEARSVAWRVEVGSEIRAPVAIVDHAIVVATSRGELIAFGDG